MVGEVNAKKPYIANNGTYRCILNRCYFNVWVRGVQDACALTSICAWNWGSHRRKSRMLFIQFITQHCNKRTRYKCSIYALWAAVRRFQSDWNQEKSAPWRAPSGKHSSTEEGTLSTAAADSGKVTPRSLGLQPLHVSCNLVVGLFWPEDGLPVLAIVFVSHREHAFEPQPGNG